MSKISNKDWQQVNDSIKKGVRFTLTTHINPDGDGIGSEIALYYFLKNLSKEVKIINHTKTPDSFKFLETDPPVIERYSKKHNDWIQNSDVIFILDISTSERLGNLGSPVNKSKAIKICLDHHVSNNSFGDINIIDHDACATGELVYDLISKYNKAFTKEIAEALYISILTDTGSFRFSNSSPRSHIITAELLEMGVEPRAMYEKVYEMTPWEKVFLFQKALATLRKESNGKIAYMYITQKMLDETGAKREDIEGFVDYLNIIKNIEIAILFVEAPKEGVKISLRSKGQVNVNKLAGIFGGGGHYHAAGIMMHGFSLPEAMKKLLETIKENLKE